MEHCFVLNQSWVLLGQSEILSRNFSYPNLQLLDMETETFCVQRMCTATEQCSVSLLLVHTSLLKGREEETGVGGCKFLIFAVWAHATGWPDLIGNIVY